MRPGAALLAVVALAACSPKPTDSAAAPTPTTDSGPDTEPETGAETDCPPLHRFVDADGDGFGGDAVVVCKEAPGLVRVSGDCNDADPGAYPGASELCDGVDQDCDETIDDEPVIAWQDNDGDGYGDRPADCPPSPDDAPLPGDCADDNPAVHPGAIDVCNGVDDDCDGQWDEGPDAPASVMDGVSSDCDSHGEIANIDETRGARFLGELDEAGQELDRLNALTVADVNGDGLHDILVGSEISDYPREDWKKKSGVVYAFLGPIGPGDRWTDSADFVVYGGQGADVNVLEPTGDVTGDGVEDYVVGGHNGSADGAVEYSGTAYLVPGPLTEDVDLGSGYHQYGTPPWGYRMEVGSVQPGDLDGDGLAEVMLGCLDADPYVGGAAVYLVHGPATVPLEEATTTYLIDASEVAAGITGTSLGDVTGDGVTDLALMKQGAVTNPGDFFVLASERHSGQVPWRDAGPLYGWFDAPEWDAHLEPGYTLRNLGDVTGDGYDDVGLPSINYGYMHVMAGPLPTDRPFDVFAESPAVLQDSLSASGGLFTVESRGDVDGDGTSDLVLGSAGYTVPGLSGDWGCDWEETCDYGALYLINGPFEGYVDLSVEADLIQGVHDYGMLGWDLEAGMDLDGDGATDIVASALNITDGLVAEEAGGAAYVLFGVP